MGGRVAEELSQDDVTTGAGNDIDRATDLARQMVCDWGMSNLGPLAYGKHDEPVFLGRDMHQQSDYSEETAQQIDEEIRRLVEEGHDKATSILKEHSAILDRVAQELLENEVIDGNQIYAMIEELTGQDRRPEHVPIRVKPVIEVPSEAPRAAADDEDDAASERSAPGSPEPAPAQ